MADIIKPEKAPWDQKPGIEQKLEIDESQDLFDDWDDSSIPFDEDNRENDMVYDYKAARRNAHFCVHASKKILNMIAGNLLYERNPLVADACVKLVKVISENNRDLIKIHKDFKTTKLIGKPAETPLDGGDDESGSEADRKDKVKTTVSEVVAAAKAAKENNNDGTSD
jgi:hypothetical protein